MIGQHYSGQKNLGPIFINPQILAVDIPADLKSDGYPTNPTDGFYFRIGLNNNREKYRTRKLKIPLFSGKVSAFSGLFPVFFQPHSGIILNHLHINVNGTQSIIMNAYHYIRNHFVRRSDCTYIIFYGPYPRKLLGRRGICALSQTRHSGLFLGKPTFNKGKTGVM